MTTSNEIEMFQHRLEFAYLPLAALRAHPDNRTIDNGPDMEELKTSIEQSGIIQPITVRRMDDEAEEVYEILAGHRRAHAASWLAMETVPCLIRHGCTDDEAMAIVFIENFERKPLNPMEEAEGLDAWMRVCDVGMASVAKRIGRPLDYVQAMLRLNDLDMPSRKLVRTGAVKKETLLVLGHVSDPESFCQAAQLVLFPSMQSEPLNPRQAKQIIQTEIEGPRKAKLQWESNRPKVQKKWQAVWDKAGYRLRIVVNSYEDVIAMRNCKDYVYVEASATVPVDLLLPEYADGTLTWGQVAASHDLLGDVLPWGPNDEPTVMVRKDLCLEGERAKAEHDMPRFLAFASAVPVAKDDDEVATVAPDEWMPDEPKPEAPPEERHVRNDSGSMILVSRDKIERAMSAVRTAVFAHLEPSDYLDLPPFYFEHACSPLPMPDVMQDESFQHRDAGLIMTFLKWVLDGCPTCSTLAELEEIWNEPKESPTIE
jgi:ParB family chromosome partitioning protein